MGIIDHKVSNVSICYAIASFLIFFSWGSTHEASRSAIPIALLYSWLGLLAKFLLQLVAPANPYWPRVSSLAVLATAAFLIVGTLIYLYLLSLIIKMTFRISRMAGGIFPPLLHLLGSLLVLMPLRDSASWVFDSWSFASLVLVVAYFLVSLRMLNKARDQKAPS